MIWYLVVHAFVSLLDAISSTLSFLLVDSFPFGADQYLILAFGYIKALADFFPPLGTLMLASFFYILYKGARVAAQLFLGHRSPA